MTQRSGSRKRRRLWSLQTKLLGVTVPLVLVSTFLAFGLFELRARETAARQLEAKLAETISIQALVLAEPIWNIANEQIELVLAALMTDQDVVAVAVYDEDGERIAEEGDLERLNDPLSSRTEIFFGPQDDAVVIGSLAIALSSESLAVEARSRLTLALALAGILLAAIVAATVFANRRIVGRPVDLLIQSIEAEDRSGRRMQVDWQTSDEMGAVVAAFNDMIKRQDAYEAQLRAANDDLEQRVNDRTAELGQARLQLADAISSISEGFAIFDNKRRLQVANGRFREIMTGGADDAAILGQDLEQILMSAASDGRFAETGADQAEWVAEQNRNHLEDHDAFTLKTGNGGWLLVNTRRTQSGGLVAVYSDISELKATQDQLETARDEAEAANDAKSSFLATMSHEIRTPLNGIIGMSSLLDGTRLDDEQRDFSTTIRSAAETLLTIINDILDFSKVEAGALELESLPLGLAEVVEDCAGLVATKASEKSLEIACRIASDVPHGILGDPVRLKQVLLNLLNNAVKFTDEGEVVLSVDRIDPINEIEPMALRFSVRDTGIGIPADRMDRLFRSFSQVDASTTRRYGGTGLGLVITKRLVELMGGEITVESVVGQGTTFSFTLPTTPAEAPGRQSRAEQLQAMEGKHVLVVDDNRSNLTILDEKLSDWKLQTTIFNDPTDALAALKSAEDFDLCIFDYKMPKLNGCELANAAREAVGEALPPMILFTSISPLEPGFQEDLTEARFSSVLMKPARSSQLLAALSKSMGVEVEQPAQEAEVVVDVKSLSILLVDDNAINRKVGTKILRRLGYSADLACDGSEAVEMAVAGNYDLVLMDIEMPDMDGITATGLIRERMQSDAVPYVVALTANAMASEAASYLESGMDGYLSKPVNVDELVKSLDEAAHHRRRRFPEQSLS